MSIDLSRVENILETMLGRSEIKEPAQSRVEELLIELKEAIEEGGTGGDITALIARIAKCERDISSIETVDETQTQQIQSIVTSLGEFRTAIENLDTDVENKADKSTTYTKTEVETALSGKVDKETGKGLSTNDYTTAEKTKLAGIAEGAEVNEIESIKVNNTTINPDANKVVNITVPTTAADVSALPDTTKYAVALSLTINSSTFVMTGQLKDQNGDNLGTAQTIDLPLESVVVGGSYNSQTKKVVLTLQNGNTIEFSVADLVSGLQTELSTSNKLNPAFIEYDSTHRAVSDTEKSVWNSKQNALSSTQLDAVNSGIDSTKVEQIETNKNNILLKANTSDVSAATANLQAQIDNIVGGSTEDSEVINARVSSDGVTYATLNGRITAIETDLSILPNDIDSIPITFELGGLGMDGSLRDNFTNRARAGFLPCNPALKIRFAPNTKHRIAYYQDNRIAEFISMTAWSDTLTDTIDIPSGKTYAAIYILVGYTDDREITNDNIPNVWFECEKSNFNEAVHVNGYYCAQDMPTMGKNDNFATTGFIPIESNATYRFSTIRIITTYDSTLTPVRYLGFTNITDNSITFSPTEKYVMFSWRLSDATSVYFAKSNEYVGGAYIKDLVPISLNGKKLSLLGDSISAFAGTIPTGNDAYYTGSNSGVENKTQMWWYVLCQKTGMIPLVINGYSGSGITQLTDTAHSSKVPMSDTTRDESLHSGTTNPDIILIAGGLNDYTYAEQSSQMPSNWDGTTTPVKGNSFDETYACMIKEMQTAYPTAIVVCLSTWFSMRGTDNGYTLTNSEGLTQADYDNAIENVAKIMRVPYINAEMCGFSRSNYYPTYAEDSGTVPTHPNATGHKVIGEYLANVLPPIVKAFVK